MRLVGCRPSLTPIPGKAAIFEVLAATDLSRAQNPRLLEGSRILACVS